MAKRSYNQYCGLAAALDLLGERWSLLLLRNLLLGPQRFTDLLDGLPGIGTGLLTDRLKQLEAAGVIARAALPPPAASTVYELTQEGEQLRPVLLGLARWGLRRLGEPASGQYVAPDLFAIALQARFTPDAAAGIDGEYELRIGADPYRVVIADNAIEVLAGAAAAPRAVLNTDTATLAALNHGSLSVSDALGTGGLTVAGEITILPKLAQAFGLRRSDC